METKALNQAVKRNQERFPERNCFQLNKNELPKSLKSQLVTLNESGNKRGLHIKKMPFAFTEQGVAMLASVLRSETAIRVSLQIMDAFVEMRHYLMQNGGLVHRLSNIETEVLDQRAKLVDHDRKLDEVFEAMDRGELKSKGLFCWCRQKRLLESFRNFVQFFHIPLRIDFGHNRDTVCKSRERNTNIGVKSWKKLSSATIFSKNSTKASSSSRAKQSLLRTSPGPSTRLSRA
ncbi:ORF6N domain-containing protein [uncultured Fibrobacter sp.]|uniref:ORF6N domain-containing protein n=1 Tax=uncultured Fibrobacter sp. TaxID=261512 RepID=UPI00344F2BD4